MKHEVQTGLERSYKLRPDPSPYSWIIISTMMWENVCENTSKILKFCWCLFLCCFRMTWAEALSTVQSYQTHLEQMSSESLIGLRLAEDPHIQSYHKKIDSCMGDSSKVGTWRFVFYPYHPTWMATICIWAGIGCWKPTIIFCWSVLAWNLSFGNLSIMPIRELSTNLFMYFACLTKINLAYFLSSYNPVIIGSRWQALGMSVDEWND